MRILITGGPTNEPIDKVMKITNMSTGSMAVKLAENFRLQKHDVVAVLNNSVNTRMNSEFSLEEIGVRVIRIETTMDLMEELEKLSYDGDFDYVIHSCAVGDYCSDFVFRMEDMAKEIIDNLFSDFKYLEEATTDEMVQSVLKTLVNPNCKVSDNSKISSYEPNLTVKLGLTTKVISNLRKWFPYAKLYGFKLLENVSHEKLIEVATKLCVKNHMDGIFANDLAELKTGKSFRYVVDENGYTGIVVDGADGIFSYLSNQ